MKKAFTLIELLVVIAIIAILAAILFPVFAQAKSAAKKTQSLSNMKNLATGHLIYSSDADDYYCMLQFYTALPPATTGCQKQTKWGDAIYPYVKNGGGTTWQQSFDLNEGIFMSPGGKRQSGGSYALHQDVFMDGAAPWTGCAADADFRVFSQTQIEDLANKVSMIERGNSPDVWAYLQFATWRWGWTDANVSRSTMTYLGPDTENDINARAGGVSIVDCDAANGTSGDPWYTCSMFPRYRWNNSMPVAFFDGHAKTFSRTGITGQAARASSQLDFIRNILIPEAIRPGWSSWYLQP